MVEKYIIDKSDIHKLLTGQDIELDKGSKARAFLLEIQGNPTNGDIVKAMFPDARVSEIFPSFNCDEVYYVPIEKFNGVTNEMRVIKSWWNAPYQGVEK